MSVAYTMNPKILLVRDQPQYSSSTRLRPCPSQFLLQLFIFEKYVDILHAV